MIWKVALRSVISLACIFTIASPLHADYGSWTESGEVICSAEEDQFLPAVAPDGNGGAFIAWTDYRNAGGDYRNLDIYMQHVDANGDTLWDKDGIIVGDHTQMQFSGSCRFPQVISDGNGGAIIVFAVGYTPALHVQHVDEDGNLLWGSTGVIVQPERTMNYHVVYEKFDIASDGSGGVVVTWNLGYYDAEMINHYAVYAQRVDSSGTIKWGDPYTGLGIYDANNKTRARITSDGRNGAIITWNYNVAGSVWHMYAQRVDSTGTKKWGSYVQVSTGNYVIEYQPDIASDGLCGAIITWTNNSNGRVYAQRVDSNGNVDWQSDVAVCEPYVEVGPIATEDGGNGALISYWGSDLLAVQKIDKDGNRQWGTDGVIVCSSVYESSYETCHDGQGGAIAAWRDRRSGDAIYAMRVDSSGRKKWKNQGIPICTSACYQQPPRIVPNGTTGGIITWESELDSDSDIYAQRIDSYFDFTTPDCNITYQFIDASGDTMDWRDFMNGCPAGDFETLKVFLDFDEADVPRDIEKGEIIIDKPDTLIRFWSNGDIEADSAALYGDDIETSITHSYFSHNYDFNYKTILGMDVNVLLNGNVLGVIDSLIVKSLDYTGDGTVDLSDLVFFSTTYNKCYPHEHFNSWFDFNDDSCVDLSEFVYLGEHYRCSKPSGYQGMFPTDVRTLSDVTATISRGEGSEGEMLLVDVTLSNYGNFTCLCLGLNIDPSTVEYAGWIPNSSFPATSVAGAVTREGEEMIMISAFGLERPGSHGLELGTIAFSIVDGSAVGDAVTFEFGDILDQKGEIKQMRLVKMEQPDEMPILSNSLGNNYPNPFNPTTTIEYSIARDSHVNLLVYNVKGQLVRTLVDQFEVEGTYRAVWDGQDNAGKAVSSGVYFYRIETAHFSESKKLVLLR